MRKLMYLFALPLLLLSCESDNNEANSKVRATFNFTHNWDGTNVSNTNSNTIQFTNANGNELSITRLRYLISKITFTDSNAEEFILDGYNLVDVTNNSNLSFTPSNTIPQGNYSSVKFTFGFNNDDNYNVNYTDLNSASWSVPAMLGGGYHYMQLEGRFTDNTSTETGYAYHTIRAVDNTGSTLIFQDTFFEVDLGAVTITDNVVFNIEMNIAEWFKAPNTWDLNILNNTLMPNFNAQVLMFENGQNVFSLDSVTQ